MRHLQKKKPFNHPFDEMFRDVHLIEVAGAHHVRQFA